MMFDAVKITGKTKQMKRVQDLLLSSEALGKNNICSGVHISGKHTDIVLEHYEQSDNNVELGKTVVDIFTNNGYSFTRKLDESNTIQEIEILEAPRQKTWWGHMFG